MSETILIISDLHAPFNHPDSIEFLSAINKKYQPKKIICIGDEADFNAISYHEKDPNLFSPAQELERAKIKLRKLAEMFPVMSVLNSNHGSLIHRKVKSSGLSASIVRPLHEILDVPNTWTWHDELIINNIYFHHGMNSNAMKMSTSLGMSVVFGHYHSKMSIEYWSSPSGLFFAMQTGCLIDQKSMAFAYNKLDVKRPIIGTAIIENGFPKLLPMLLTKAGRWSKILP